MQQLSWLSERTLAPNALRGVTPSHSHSQQADREQLFSAASYTCSQTTALMDIIASLHANVASASVSAKSFPWLKLLLLFFPNSTFFQFNLPCCFTKKVLSPPIQPCFSSSTFLAVAYSYPTWGPHAKVSPPVLLDHFHACDAYHRRLISLPCM